jgi:serine/threonine protein kinase
MYHISLYELPQHSCLFQGRFGWAETRPHRTILGSPSRSYTGRPAPRPVVFVFAHCKLVLTSRLVATTFCGTHLPRWNEMKIIRPINSEQHPSIVSFNCFIITPSYAIIAMSVLNCQVARCCATHFYSREYLPTLMQVEIDERRAKPWFASLASAIEWLHAHGVVHNDIKCVEFPAFSNFFDRC